MVWLDWMKVMAIFSIVWGHFFSAGHLYLYVFNVQVFCVISGFLYKRADSWRSCLAKCFWQLFVPTVILSTVMQAEAWLRLLAMGETYDVTWTWYLKWLLLGHRWCMGPCWYFYSLAVMRLVMQLLPERRWVYGLLFVALAAGAVALRRQGIEVSNANVNVLVCMPMFLVGVLLKPLRQQLGRLRNYWIEVALGVVAVAGVVLCGRWNGYVWMYLCGYGDNFVLYVLGGLAGSSRLPYRSMVLTLSKGSILIIGLHIILVRRLQELPDRMWGEDLLLSVLIVLCFVPIVRLAELFFPILLGRRRKR